jgi:predicted enzyme related to lactoylglutathione lyase
MICMTSPTTTRRRYPHGVPSWVDTEQPDPVAAAHFYGELFGWEVHEVMPAGAPGSYLIATIDGDDVAAIAPGDGRPCWSTYIACDDADATVAAVLNAGGSVVAGPVDAGPGGRTATCADPQRATLRLWQARRRLGAQLVNRPGTWNFSDLHTADPSVMGFYSSVFGWVRDDSAAGMIRVPGYGDHLASTVDPGIYERQSFAPRGFADIVAGLAITDERPGWQVRFTVEDRDDSVERAERLGATVVSSADTEWTREAVIADPQGAILTLSQFSPPA